MADSNEDTSIDTSAGDGDAGDTLERLRNITKMFGSKKDDDEDIQLQRVEKVAPSEKIKNRFEKFESKIASNSIEDGDEEEDNNESGESGGVIRSKHKRKPLKETVPYHEMAEVKDKFEKGLVDSEKPRVEKRLDVRVKSGTASAKKQAFEQGEFEQVVEPYVNKVQIDTELVAGLASAKKQAFEQQQLDQDANLPKSVFIDTEAFAGAAKDKKNKFEKGEFEQVVEPHASRVQIDTELVAGLAAAKKQAFEQQLDQDTNLPKSVILDPEAFAGAAKDKKNKFEKGEFEQVIEPHGSKVQIDTELVAGLAAAKKQAFKQQLEQDTNLPKSVILDPEAFAGAAKDKKNKFEKGEFDQFIEPHGSKVQIDTELVAGLAAAKKQAFEQQLDQDANLPKSVILDPEAFAGAAKDKKNKFEKGEFEQVIEPHGSKVQIDTELVAGLAAAKKQAFEQQLDQDANLTRSVVIDPEVFAGAAKDKKNKFEKGEFEQDAIDLGLQRAQADANLLVGAASEKKAKFESGQVAESGTTLARTEEIASIAGAGLAQNKRSELLSKIEAEQQVMRSGDRHIDIDTEHGLATARREQLASLANSEFKSTEKHIDVTTGLASTIKEQFMADTNKPVKSTVEPVSVESGLAKSRATVFENPDDTSNIKRTVEIDNELLERGVAKERVAMFKNLESGTQAAASSGVDPKIRVDENGNVVRESDKREEIYFEKGQTKQLVEQWKTRKVSPDRDNPDAQVIRDAEILQQGKAKNLVELWKTMDKENTPPPERRGPRAITPPPDGERQPPPPEDDEMASRKSGYADDKANIESGHARAVRERLMQNVEQGNTVTTKKSLKQITPPPEGTQRISPISSDTENNSSGIAEQYNYNEEFVPTKGQAQSLKNRFAELEKDALKVETAAAKIKYTPKRFVDTPAPKQVNVEPAVDSSKCSACHKTVYAMEKIEADKKVYHKSCFKCMHCKSILKLGNFTANDGQIYCKPHFLQLFAIKGNYSSGFGLNDHKARWLANSSLSSSPSSMSNTHESTMSNES